MKAIGEHKRTEAAGKDINGREMVICYDCEASAHARDIPTAESQLSQVKCVTNCQNCKNLRSSHTKKPAVPIGGDCNTMLHVCPNDGNRWWQSNDYFHLWQQVTDPKEWEILLRQEPDHRKVLLL
jgi:hypothetical protein